MPVKRLSSNELLDLAAQRGLTDDEICDITGAWRQTLHRWRTGESEIPKPRRAKILAAISE